ncbi:MAG: signal peptidase I [Phycisphaerae bacterium]
MTQQAMHPGTAANVTGWRARVRRRLIAAARWALPLVPVVVLCLAVKSSLADWNDVPTGSMKPTILEGDRIFVNKLAYDLKVPFTTWHVATWGDPQRGDVVVFFSPHDGTRLVKRVVGLPGDTIELRDNRVLVNGTSLAYSPPDAGDLRRLAPEDRPGRLLAHERLGKHDHPMMATPTAPSPRWFGPVRVPADQYFVMGDNRDQSYDSRFWGAVPRSAIVGRAVGVAISLDAAHGWKPRWSRFFRGLP